MKVALALLGTVLVGALCLLPSLPTLSSYDDVRHAYRPSDAWLLDRNGDTLAQLRIDYRNRRLGWTTLDEVAPVLIETVKRAEDQRFDRHGGVDGLALAGALRDDLLHHARRGGSTLSMQLAAQLAPDGSSIGRRSLQQKIRQMRLTWALEQGWTKAQILEAYLNLVSYRGEMQGIAAASSALFGKAPAQLNPRESAVLAALLKDPGADLAKVARRACLITTDIDCNAIERTAKDALGPGHQPELVAALAPHLAHALLKQGGDRVASTLDADTQRLVFTALRNQLATLSASEVRDAAGVVLDNATGDVLAYVGSAGPQTTAAAVDGASALRQAGSTLKPFLYGLAFERRILTPASLLDDSQVSLETGAGLYIPENYDHEFRGLVSARNALAGSLNVPAVRTLLLVGLEPLRSLLSDFGYSKGLTESGEFYGYSLALGAPEVSLLEQANAYRALANGGLWSPTRIRRDDVRAAPRRVLSSQAAFLVQDILGDAGARAGSFGLGSPLSTPFWSSAKTGTSKNMRDNWCIGFTSVYTVAVWVGNFEGEPMHNVSGVTGAAPAWLDIISELSERRASVRPNAPAGVVHVPVKFHKQIEPARQEWFIAGTEQTDIRAALPDSGHPHIVSPANGLIAALDPDIPANRQHILFEAANVGAAHWELDGHKVGSANTRLPWPPLPGHHRLRLVSATGRELDTSQFEVRQVADGAFSHH